MGGEQYMVWKSAEEALLRYTELEIKLEDLFKLSFEEWKNKHGVHVARDYISEESEEPLLLAAVLGLSVNELLRLVGGKLGERAISRVLSQKALYAHISRLL
jgi:hypothetical protein